MSENRSERRFRRVPTEHTALVTTIAAEVEGFARTNSVSIGGCGILTREPIGAGVAVEILLTIEGRIVQVFGRTVYERPLGDGQIEIGVEFLDVIAEDAALLESILGDPS